MISQSYSENMDGGVDLSSGLERRRRVVSKKVVNRVENANIDKASYLDRLRYKHCIGKQRIKFISLSGPERSEFYTKAANVVQESASSVLGTYKPMSYMDGARRVAAEFGIIIDIKTDSQRIKASITLIAAN